MLLYLYFINILPRGIEPLYPPRKGGVLPLDQGSKKLIKNLPCIGLEPIKYLILNQTHLPFCQQGKILEISGIEPLTYICKT